MSALSQIPVQEFLEKVKARGIHLQVNGDRIRVGWPEKTPDMGIRQIIINRKPEILEALSLPPGSSASTNHFSDAEKEYYFNLLEIMQSPKFGMRLAAARGEAWKIVDEYRERKTVDHGQPSVISDFRHGASDDDKTHLES